jgi:hypothetical protein
MSKRKLILSAIIVLIFVGIIMTFTLYFTNKPSAAVATPDNLLSENPGNPQSSDAPVFVIPENPLGTIGLISGLVVAFGIFALRKRQEN